MKENLEKLDEKIIKLSKKSKAPEEFMENELRRMTNITLLNCFEWEDRRQQRILDGKLLDHYFEDLEREYMCYFQRKEFEKTIYPRSWGNYTYAGCNAQIEHFLSENSFNKVLEKLGFTRDFSGEFEPAREIPKKDIPDRMRRYMIGIGYLYPKKRKMLVHPNMLMAQVLARYSGDSPFLSRDLIRCPYLEADIESAKLSDRQLWNYWGELVALTLASFPEYKMHWPDDSKAGTIRDDMKPYLGLGKKLVPQRYINLVPKIEKFSWIFPENKLS